MLEFAIHCKRAMKHGAKGRFFICVHCGKANFSNKLRLNHHRFEEGCKSAKHPNGMLVLLLPYLDFLLGQRNMVEVMGKGAVDRAKKMKAKVGDGFGVDYSYKEDEKNRDGNDSNFAEDIGGYHASKRSN